MLCGLEIEFRPFNAFLQTFPILQLFLLSDDITAYSIEFAGLNTVLCCCVLSAQKSFLPDQRDQLISLFIMFDGRLRRKVQMVVRPSFHHFALGLQSAETGARLVVSRFGQHMLNKVISLIDKHKTNQGVRLFCDIFGVGILGCYKNCMFSLVSKTVHSKEAFAKLSKFCRFTLEFDGSVSKLIQNLSGEQLIVKTLHHNSHLLSNIHENSLADSVSLESQQVQVRYVELMTSKLGTLVFARSYWSKSDYEAIMAKNPHKAIGFNLIDQKIEQYREINWTGDTTIKLSNGLTMSGFSRSYAIRSKGATICEIQQYFTPNFTHLFS